jgi:FkbM family methyltransferase
MNEKLIRFIKTLVRPYVDKHFGQMRNRRFSYAQEGEDLVVDRLLEGKKKGFYVEIGCHHPFRFSNTYMFYKKGWRGICIDPLPGTKKLFNATRPRDFVIEVGVGEQGGALIYHMFNEPALNTFDPDIAKQQQIEVRRLDEILANMPNIPTIDIMSVDVEGFDLQVLKSNDWNKFRPKIVIAECLTSDLLAIQSDPINILLTTQGYVAYAKTGHSVIFKLDENV